MDSRAIVPVTMASVVGGSFMPTFLLSLFHFTMIRFVVLILIVFCSQILGGSFRRETNFGAIHANSTSLQ